MLSKKSKIKKLRDAVRAIDLNKEAVKLANKDKRIPQILKDQMRLTEGVVKWEYSSGEYKEYKRSKASYIGIFPRVDFYDTGKFQKGIFSRAQGGSLVFDSTDSKSDKLRELYGDNIFELTLDYQQAVQMIAQQNIIDILKETLT